MSTRINIHTSAEKPLRLEAQRYNEHCWISILEGEGHLMFAIFPPEGTTSYETLRVACEAFNAALGPQTQEDSQ